MTAINEHVLAMHYFFLEAPAVEDYVKSLAAGDYDMAAELLLRGAVLSGDEVLAGMPPEEVREELNTLAWSLDQHATQENE